MRIRCCAAIMAAWLLAGCGTDAGLVVNDSSTDKGMDVVLPEVAEETTVFPEVAPEAGPDLWLAEVEENDISFEPGPGEAGYPCASGDECNDGYCIQTADGMLCTQVCQEECPFGWQCALHTPSLPDQVYICVPTMLQLCRPCSANSECWANGVDAGEACVSYGPGGYFCGAACMGPGDCPLGFDCLVAEVKGGALVSQCVMSEGECDCSESFVDEQAETACYVENEWGQCPGARVCMADGLSPCDAAVPAAEECNSLDDDCDGAVDEEAGGGPCWVENATGKCAGTEVCQEGVLTCNGPAPAPEICDGLDNNCDGQTDEGFPDTNGDGIKDCLVSDKDGDGVLDVVDNCPAAANTNQADFDLDGDGDACDLDDDNDLVADTADCAPFDPDISPDEEEICNGTDDDCDYLVDEGFSDADFDGLKDCVDEDDDGDGTVDGLDCAPLDADTHPGANELCDGVDNDCDNEADEGFDDQDLDGLADCVDEDDDGDGVDDDDDNCPGEPNEGQEDLDGDGIGDACETDADGDAIPDAVDNCPGVKNTLQGDQDNDGLGDDCDGDLDGDGADNEADNCPLIPNLGQEDGNNDGVGDACELDKDGDGVEDALDCAPLEPAAYPGAPESCDDLDNDCDGIVDEGFNDNDFDGLKDCVDNDDDNDGEADGADCAPLNAAVNSDAVEVCDLVDNDCDGSVDEELGATTCGLGECFHQVDNCAAGLAGVCNPFEGASPEVCDNADNDCDGIVDEDQGSSTCGFGQCAHTVANCLGGEVQLCDAMEGAEDEVCDGIDNDCDAKVDEEMPTLACGEGQCFHTTPSCIGGVSYDCDPLAGAVPETCDGLDNDCDGSVDEELGTLTCGLGECEHTVDLCVEGVAQFCNPFEGSAAEACDNLDNDCDGLVDEDLGAVTCGLGNCQHQVQLCVGGAPQLCDPMEGFELETCDGSDNDCDGLVDEQLGTTTCGLGPCDHTVDNCVDGIPQVCDPMEGSDVEECDGVDNNCSGEVDEGFSDNDNDGSKDCVDLDDDNDGDPDLLDCEPFNAEIGPGTEEVCDNGVDDDCNPDTADQCILASCWELHQAQPGAASGTYWVDPTGGDNADAFEVECDMSTDGGGWNVVDDFYVMNVVERHAYKEHQFELSDYGYSPAAYMFSDVFVNFKFAGELDDANNYVNTYFNNGWVNKWKNGLCNVGFVQVGDWPRKESLNDSDFTLGSQPEGDVDADCGNGQGHGINHFELVRFRVISK